MRKALHLKRFLARVVTETLADTVQALEPDRAAQRRAGRVRVCTRRH